MNVLLLNVLCEFAKIMITITDLMNVQPTLTSGLLLYSGGSDKSVIDTSLYWHPCLTPLAHTIVSHHCLTPSYQVMSLVMSIGCWYLFSCFFHTKIQAHCPRHPPEICWSSVLVICAGQWLVRGYDCLLRPQKLALDQCWTYVANVPTCRCLASAASVSQ